MPRGRGGVRQGKPGVAYPQRTDLNQPVRTAPSQTYGDATTQAQAQQAIPLPQGPPPPPMQPFHRPTDRPNEPLTAGMAQGPGPGPSAAQPTVNPIAETLRAAIAAQSSPQLLAMLESVL